MCDRTCADAYTKRYDASTLVQCVLQCLIQHFKASSTTELFKQHAIEKCGFILRVMESLMFAQLVQGGIESIMLWNSVAKKRVDAMEKCSFFAVQDTKHSRAVYGSGKTRTRPDPCL